MMSGTSVDNLLRAVRTYSNEVGPGHYNSPEMFGKKRAATLSKHMKSEAVIIGLPRLPNIVNPGTKMTVGMKGASPSPDSYKYNTDNPGFRRNVVSTI
jgi:hypothetical protein